MPGCAYRSRRVILRIEVDEVNYLYFFKFEAESDEKGSCVARINLTNEWNNALASQSLGE